MTSYTKRCTNLWRVCWCKFGRNPTKGFWEICILVSLSLIPRQDLYLDFACLPIYSLAINPELFVCLSIYENAETLFPRSPDLRNDPGTVTIPQYWFNKTKPNTQKCELNKTSSGSWLLLSGMYHGLTEVLRMECPIAPGSTRVARKPASMVASKMFDGEMLL